MADWIGRTLSKVEIEKRIGRGGIAEVYLGHHTTLNRPVAVKILHAHLSEDELLLDRFRAEAQAVAALRHPNVVQVFDFDVAEGSPYIVMELLEGLPLDDYLDALRQVGRGLPPETVVRLMLSIASALDYAHARGIVHRDVKPANIILRRALASGPIDPGAPLPLDVDTVLTDFGVARLAGAAARTLSGSISGTPAYLSPEQARGETVDARSDIYSLGVTLYELLAGKLPFTADSDTPFAVILKHISEAPPLIPNLNPAVQAVLDCALAKERDARYQTAGEFAAALLKGMFGAGANLATAPKSSPGLPVQELIDTLDLLMDQARAYERALPPNNYPARAAVTALAELGRQALTEARDLAAALAAPPQTAHPFSPRELEVLQLAAEGLTNKAIAYRLGISERTVQFHMNSVFNKTGTSSRTEAVALALQRGWLSPSALNPPSSNL